jgi:hypothetical protein
MAEDSFCLLLGQWGAPPIPHASRSGLRRGFSVALLSRSARDANRPTTMRSPEPNSRDDRRAAARVRSEASGSADPDDRLSELGPRCRGRFVSGARGLEPVTSCLHKVWHATADTRISSAFGSQPAPSTALPLARLPARPEALHRRGAGMASWPPVSPLVATAQGVVDVKIVASREERQSN